MSDDLLINLQYVGAGLVCIGFFIAAGLGWGIVALGFATMVGSFIIAVGTS